MTSLHMAYHQVANVSGLYIIYCILESFLKYLVSSESSIVVDDVISKLEKSFATVVFN